MRRLSSQIVTRLKYYTNIYLLLVLALSVFAWAPLLTPAYFFQAHDAKHSVFFLVEFDQAFRDGFWWPRWAPDFSFGYGYPLFNLYAPLAFYVAEGFHLLGLGFTAAVKTVYILATIGAGLAMYGFAGRLFGRPAGLLAAVVYMYAPFHLVEIFVRSAYAEFVALALVPLVFWAFTELLASPSPRRLALAGAAYGLLALTHHASFLTFSPLLMVYLLYLILARGRFNFKALTGRTLAAGLAGLLGLALAAIYLLPVIAETRYIKVEQWTSGSYSYRQHFVYFAQFLSPEWGYGYAGPGLLDDFSFQLGLVGVVLFVFALVAAQTRRYPHHGTTLFFLVLTLVVILMMSPLAAPAWQLLPIATLVQFPWRLLGMVTFTMAVVAGSVVAGDLAIQRKESANQQISDSANGETTSSTITDLPAGPTSGPPAPPPPCPPAPLLPCSPAPPLPCPPSGQLILLTLVVILASFAYTLPQYTEIPAWAETPLAVINWDRASIVDRVGMMAATQEQPQTGPLEPLYLAGKPLEAGALIAGQGQIETLHRGGASSTARVNAAGPVTLQFYTYDYPGWRVTAGGQSLPHRAEPPHGLITVDLPAGEHTVHLSMGTTPARTTGTIISGLALLVIGGLLLKK